jgi:hypothetical protein
MRWSLVGIASLLVSSWAPAQLIDAESQLLGDTLFLANITRDGLKMKAVPDAKSGSWITQALADPIGVAAESIGFHRAALANPLTIPSQFVNLATGYSVDNPLTPETSADTVESILKPLAQTMVRADLEIRESLAKLSPAEQRQMIEALAVHSAGPRSAPVAFVQSPPLNLIELQSKLAQIDVAKIVRASHAVYLAALTAQYQLAKIKLESNGKKRQTIEGLPVIIGGTTSDLHDETDARITIDLGGNDRYTGRHGAGVGYTSVLIDLGGNDQYRTPDLSIGGAILGAGIAFDLNGDDTYVVKNLSLGFAAVGVGIVADFSGNDTYSSGSATQGFSQHGVGSLLDLSGDDRYTATSRSMGAGFDRGLGWLCDSRGEDIYKLELGFGQGFAGGLRDSSPLLSGGVGFLTDGSGDDVYVAQFGAQGAAHARSLGSLFDATGNDMYRITSGGQGSGLNLGLGTLTDQSGDDLYQARSFHAGSARNFGAGILIDRGGDDTYGSEPATATTSGLALLLDTSGSDRYAAKPGTALQNGLAIAADGGGLDSYGELRPFPNAAVDGSLGIRYQSVLPTPQTLENPLPGNRADLFELAKELPFEKSLVAARARQALMADAKQTLPWIIESRLNGLDDAGATVAAEVLAAAGPDGLALIGRKSLGGSDAELESVIRIGIAGKVSDIGAILPRVLKDKPELRYLAIKAAKEIKARGTVDSLLPLMFQSDDLTKRVAMAALAEMGDSASAGTGGNSAASLDPFVRQAALALILKNPQQSELLGKTLLEDMDESKARTGVHLLGQLNMFNSMTLVGQSLSDPRPGVRISALLELNGRCPAEFRETMVSLMSDPVPPVAKIARGVRP